MALTNEEYSDVIIKETMNKVLLDVADRRRSSLGDIRLHSEITAVNFGRTSEEEDESDENNKEYYKQKAGENTEEPKKPFRRRTKSQPGPEPDLIPINTALANRINRRKPVRNVAYAEPLHSDSPTPSVRIGDDTYKNNPPLRLMLSNTLDSYSEFSIGQPSITNVQIRSPGTLDGISMRSVETLAPPPTVDKVKFKTFSHHLTIITSTIYAIFLVTLGLILFISDPFLGKDISPTYCLVLTLIGFTYIAYLCIDIRLYIHRTLKIEKLKEEHGERMQEMYGKHLDDTQSLPNGDAYIISQMHQIPPALLEPVTHVYCFSSGRHAGSFYLKMGATAFALGHLVHAVLLLTTQIGHILEDDESEDCLNFYEVVLDFTYPVYSFVQLFFIFKYSNVILLKHKVLGRFGFMHFIGSSLCFWVWTIVRETVDSLVIYANRMYGNGTNYDNNYRGRLAGTLLEEYLKIDLSGLVQEECFGNPAISTIFENFSPYLYPFTVEYSILIVGIFYIIWHNIGHCPNNDHDDSVSGCSDEMACKLPSAADSNNYSSNLIIHADCHASNKGIFGGLVVMVLTIAILILGFIFSTVAIDEFSTTGFWLSDATDLALNTIMLVAVLIAYNQIRTLDINEHPISMLDDILLFICIPAFFMDTIFTVVATVAILNVVKCINAIIMSLQAVVQTAFIVDGLRRCSNSRKLRRTKPGRELVMFLIIINVAMWIFTTFSYKSPDSSDERYEYYGKVLWSILNHISLPLCMFYRFHSSVCLADIWESAYKPGSDH